MKRIKVFVSIIISCIILFLLTDFGLYCFQYVRTVNAIRETYKKNGEEMLDENKPRFCYTYRYYPFINYYKKEVNNPYRTYGNKNEYKKPPIIVFGCSLAEGAGLNYDEKFEYYLSEQTNRMVFNYGFGGMGPSPMLLAAETDDMYNYIDSVTSEPPEYAIYVYIYGHGMRIFNNKYLMQQYDMYQIGYNQRNGKLVRGNTILSFFTRFAICKYFINKYVYSSRRIYNMYPSLFKRFFNQTRDELRKRYPNIKFVILIHPVNEDYLYFLRNDSDLPSKTLEELEKEGFIIFDAEKVIGPQLVDPKLRFGDNHPRKESWQIIVPSLVKQLNL